MRKPCTFTPQANLEMEATIGVGNPLDLSQPQDSHVYAFPPLRCNPTHFVVTQIVNEYWFCSLLILGIGGWVGINSFLVIWFLDSWPSFTSAHALMLPSNWCLSSCAHVMHVPLSHVLPPFEVPVCLIGVWLHMELPIASPINFI